MTIETDILNTATKAKNIAVAAETGATNAVSRNAKWIAAGAGLLILAAIVWLVH